MFCVKTDSDSDTGGHVFISYQWDSKKTVLKLRDRLRSASYRVWIDEDDICKSITHDVGSLVIFDTKVSGVRNSRVHCSTSYSWSRVSGI